jgi:hypothetical protein
MMMMPTEQARKRRTPLPCRDGRAVVIRVVMRPNRPDALVREVWPEQELDADAQPGRGRYADSY